MSGEGRHEPANASPKRTCLACRGVLPRTSLIRVALIGGHPRADIKNRAGGRGLYICLKKECLAAACKKKGAFSRAFRVSVSPEDVKELFAEISVILDARPGTRIMDDKKETTN